MKHDDSQSTLWALSYLQLAARCREIAEDSTETIDKTLQGEASRLSLAGNVQKSTIADSGVKWPAPANQSAAACSINIRFCPIENRGATLSMRAISVPIHPPLTPASPACNRSISMLAYA